MVFLSIYSCVLLCLTLYLLIMSPSANAFSLSVMKSGRFSSKTIAQNRGSLVSSRANFGRKLTDTPSKFLATKASSSIPALSELSQALTNGNTDQQQQQQQHAQDIANKGWKWSSIFMAGALAAISVGAFVSVRRSMELKRKSAIENSNRCPYCKGTGSLLCAGCLGGGTNTQDGSCPCSVCQGRTVVTCVNCKGSGSMIVA